MIDALLARRALEVFDAALDLPVEDRYRWINLQCAGDTALGDEARLLLSTCGRVTGIRDHAATPAATRSAVTGDWSPPVTRRTTAAIPQYAERRL